MELNIEYPIEQLEEKILFLKTIGETLANSPNKTKRDSYLSKNEEMLKQYETAVVILKRITNNLHEVNSHERAI